jgi:hypothetical protein
MLSRQWFANHRIALRMRNWQAKSLLAAWLRGLASRVPDRAWLPALITTLAIYVFVLAYLGTHQYDFSTFVTAGDGFSDPRLTPPGLRVLRSSAGFDGQFYYRLALDPFTHTRLDYGITLDLPALRHSRILYPLIVWALSLGHHELVPILMLLVNAAGLCLLGWLGGCYAQALGRQSLWGIVFPLFAGFALTLARDLTEIVAACCMLGALLAYRSDYPWRASLLFTLATFARETTLVASGALFLVSFVEATQPPRSAHKLAGALPFAIPAVAYLVWTQVLAFNWGQSPLAAGDITFGPPASAFLSFFQRVSARGGRLETVWFIELCYLVAFTAACAWAMRVTSAQRHEIMAWCLFGSLALCWSGNVWIEDWSYLRLLGSFFMVGAAILLGSRSRVTLPVMAAGIGLWLLVTRDVIWFR